MLATVIESNPTVEQNQPQPKENLEQNQPPIQNQLPEDVEQTQLPIPTKKPSLWTCQAHRPRLSREANLEKRRPR